MTPTPPTPRLENVSIPSEIDVIDRGEYNEIVTPANTKAIIRYHDDARVQNLHIDNSATNAVTALWPDSGFNDTDGPIGWELRNIAFTGTIPDESQNGDRLLYVSCRSGGEGLVENVHATDGDAGQANSSDPRAYPGFAGTQAGHRGHITIRNWNVQNFTSHCFYGSRGSGTVTVEDSYAVNNQMAAWRLMDGHIENCYWRGVSGVPGSRGVWIWGEATIDNCSGDMDTSSDPAIISRTNSNAHVTLSNTEHTGISGGWTDAGGNRRSSNPTHYVPEGVPQRPEDAYLGAPTGSPTPPSGGKHDDPNYVDPASSAFNAYEHRLTLRTEGHDNAFALYTTGDLKLTDFGWGTYNPNVSFSQTATHHVARGTGATEGTDGEGGGIDTYVFNGDLEALACENATAIWVDGTRYTADDWPDAPAGDGPQIADLLEQIADLERERDHLRSMLAEQADALNELDATTGETHTEVTGLRDRLREWLSN